MALDGVGMDRSREAGARVVVKAKAGATSQISSDSSIATGSCGGRSRESLISRHRRDERLRVWLLAGCKSPTV